MTWTSRLRLETPRDRVAGRRRAYARCAAWRAYARYAAVVVLVAVLAPGRAQAQFTLGDQRAGTSSGGFLKIPVGARATALGETFVAVANDPSAIFWNPAGLASLQRQEAQFSHVEWPADIQYEHLTYVLPVRAIGGSLGFQVGLLSTKIDETTELQPFGTGTTFTYSDFIAGVAYARRWTDKLLVGVGGKYVREDLGSGVGGPTISAFLVDIGSIFYLGLGSVRVGTSFSNFSPEFTPAGKFVSPVTEEVRSYDGFDAPTVFRIGLAFEPIERATQRVTWSVEMNQPADNALVLKSGLEWTWLNHLALRSGYNFGADALRFSAGSGLFVNLGPWRGSLDYAYTDGGPLGGVNRVSLGMRF